MESIDVFAPLASLQWVDRNTIHANDYNPNKVSEENLKLLIPYDEESKPYYAGEMITYWKLPTVQQTEDIELWR